MAVIGKWHIGGNSINNFENEAVLETIKGKVNALMQHRPLFI
jgi:hypothetical protein